VAAAPAWVCGRGARRRGRPERHKVAAGSGHPPLLPRPPPPPRPPPLLSFVLVK
jgi:hypothetical protein